MTPEELQQIQAIIQATINTAVAPLEQGQQQLAKQIAAVETKVEKSEQKIMKRFDQLEKLAADYLDGQVQTTKQRLDRVEKILNITP
jgi:flagellar capping protein FliD